MKRIGDILTRNKTQVEVEDGTSYKQVTIRTNYKGVVLRGSQDGATILTKNQFVVSAGQFILSRIDARNGAFGIVPEELEGAIVTNDFLAFDINGDEVEREFFNVFLQSPVFLEACIKASRGNTNRKRVDEDFFLNFQVNLPPLAAQHDLIKQINKGRTKLALAQGEITHQQSLLAKLKQAILQEAIQGKLTASWRAAHPDVEPASQLLHRIQVEKARLIAAKKLRPEKTLPKITFAETPFEIPKDWVWCRLGTILEHTFYGPRFGKSEYVEDGIPTIRTTDMSGGTLELLPDVPRVKVTEPKKIQLYELLENDLLITRTGSIGVMALFPGGYQAFPSAYLIRCRLMEAGLGPFVFMLLQSPFGQDHLGLNTKTGNRPNINSGGIISTLIPLPPLAEQAEIVERVEELMKTCSGLEAEIQYTRTHAARLLQAVLKEAFSVEPG